MVKAKEQILHLNKAGDFFSYFFWNNPLPMWVFDVFTLRFLEINPAAINMYGYSREEFLQMTIKDVRPAADIDKLEYHVPKLNGPCNTYDVWQHIIKNGTCIPVTVSSMEVGYNGMIARLVTVHNISRLYPAQPATA